MMKPMLAALAALAVSAPPAAALAQSAMSDQHPAAQTGTAATMICREAAGNEKGTAMMVASHRMLVCKTLPAGMAAGTVRPDVGKDLDPGQIDAAWQRWIQTQLAVPVTGGG